MKFINRARSLALCAIIFAAACSGQRKSLKKDPKDVDKPRTDTVQPALPDAGIDVTEASLRGAEFVDVPDLAPIYFGYDSFSLQEESLAALKKNAEYLKSRRELEILISGHCDERGTVEYNLALGQKRAKEVREYYIRLGVPGKSAATISYGEEKPVCTESDDACWAKNRRANTGVRSRMAANGHAPQDRQ